MKTGKLSLDPVPQEDLGNPDSVGDRNNRLGVGKAICGAVLAVLL